MIVVKDGNRVIKFSGEKIAHSTSYDRCKARWIEFNLFITDGGNYVLSRIGASRLVHTVPCSTVERNKIKEVPANDIEYDNAVICSECQSLERGTSTVVYPEVPRYWASVSDCAESVVDHLYKEDYNGNRYMTDVAKRLLEEALKKDPHIADAYLTEYID